MLGPGPSKSRLGSEVVRSLGAFWVDFNIDLELFLKPKSDKKNFKIDTRNLSIFETQFLMVFDEFWSVGSSKIGQKPLVFTGDREVRDFVTSPTSGSNIDRFWNSKVIKIRALELKIGLQNR